MSGDAFLHGFTRHQGLAFVFLKVVLAVAASAALYGLLQDGERSKPSVVQSMQLGGLLTLNLLLQLVAITDLASPIIVLPLIFLFPSFALLFDSSAGRTRIDGDVVATIATNICAVLSLMVGHWQEAKEIPVALIAACLAAAVDGFKLSFIKTKSIAALDVNSKVFAESVVATAILFTLCLCLRLNLKLQMPSNFREI